MVEQPAGGQVRDPLDEEEVRGIGPGERVPATQREPFLGRVADGPGAHRVGVGNESQGEPGEDEHDGQDTVGG
jgi:hypothetical protein